ncbi:MAG TPA: hypothetical protein IAB87_00010 [Candidatus Coprenecus merdipullorum]|nr:hypothetical protein [Candidatus Coprenecus merdipullorum]
MQGVIISAVIFYFVYRVLENLIHRKERLIIAQKIETLDPQKSGQMDLNKWFGAAAPNKYAPLRWGLLLTGAALGIILAFFIHHGLYPEMKWYSTGAEMLYFGLTFLFAGIGLLISFVLERKFSAEDAEKSSRQ